MYRTVAVVASLAVLGCGASTKPRLALPEIPVPDVSISPPDEYRPPPGMQAHPSLPEVKGFGPAELRTLGCACRVESDRLLDAIADGRDTQAKTKMGIGIATGLLGALGSTLTAVSSESTDIDTSSGRPQVDAGDQDRTLALGITTAAVGEGGALLAILVSPGEEALATKDRTQREIGSLLSALIRDCGKVLNDENVASCQVRLGELHSLCKYPGPRECASK